MIASFATAAALSVILSATDKRGGYVTITDEPAKECGQEFYRAMHENSEGYTVYGCWLPSHGSPNVEVLLPNKKVLIIPKSSFSVDYVEPCLTDSECAAQHGYPEN